MSDNEAGGVCDGGVRLWKWVPKFVACCLLLVLSLFVTEGAFLSI